MENKLAAAQRNMERSMIGITMRDRKTNEWIREKTKVQDILKTIKLGKWTWARHVARRTDGRKMDYSCVRVDTTHWEKKSGQTIQEMARRNRQVLGDACLDRTYKGRKILEKTC